MDALETIGQQVAENPVIIYMKGTPEFPQCGFSFRAVQALQACEVEFSHVNILADPEIFNALPKFADWPTFPQIYIDGELIGGCDITVEMYQKGELQTMAAAAVAKSQAAAD